jgi:nicotinamide riboside kinase
MYTNKTLYVVGAGAESTGKTTMLKKLYQHYKNIGYDVEYISEYLRVPCEKQLEQQLEKHDQINFVFTIDDFVEIANVHNEMEKNASNKQIVFCDTDAFTVRIWGKRYCGILSDKILDIATDHDSSLTKLYLITEYDEILTPLVQDGYRDGTEEIRKQMDSDFKNLISQSGRNSVIINGPFNGRTQLAITAVDQFIATFWTL